MWVHLRIFYLGMFPSHGKTLRTIFLAKKESFSRDMKKPRQNKFNFLRDPWSTRELIIWKISYNIFICNRIEIKLNLMIVFTNLLTRKTESLQFIKLSFIKYFINQLFLLLYLFIMKEILNYKTLFP